MCYIGNDELATYFDQIKVGELSKVNGNMRVSMKELVITYVGGAYAFRFNQK